jgi:hypothetical protein
MKYPKDKGAILLTDFSGLNAASVFGKCQMIEIEIFTL